MAKFKSIQHSDCSLFEISSYLGQYGCGLESSQLQIREHAGKWEPPFAVGGITYSVENSQSAKIRSAVRPSPAAPWHIPKGLGVLLHRFLLSRVLCCRSDGSW